MNESDEMIYANSYTIIKSSCIGWMEDAKSFGESFAIRVRAKNCNGWSDWSDRGYVLQSNVTENGLDQEHDVNLNMMKDECKE